ncbi:helix-turn-helix domain-containing protein [Desulfitibacter alkalitolerans]|jgi:predicted transcriptional regulator|uniref:helix-turn-helix domain-containing protein n=1 Tax=Desulfitibacter alkalitolerans TaxID=264641 RepID=UPI000A0179BD|nr:helix-turn-helix domain-containing protein [Desulfitibacter alkalitolerans]
MNKADIINQIYSANLTKRATLVVFYLVNRANKEFTCFPAVKTIAKDCNMSARTVQRAINDLIDAGYVKKDYRFRENGGQSSNLYTLVLNPDDGNEDEQKQPPSTLEKPLEETKEEKHETESVGVEYVNFSFYERKNDGTCVRENASTEAKKNISSSKSIFEKILHEGGECNSYYLFNESKKLEKYIAENNTEFVNDVLALHNCRREGDNFAVP